jgi:probable rRNA maturation factor
MKINIYSDYKITCPFKDDFFKQITAIVLENVSYPFNFGEISLVITDDNEMESINSIYRNINKTTDVLSFPQNEGKNLKEPLLGDIVISYDKVCEQAEESNIPISREIAFLYIHGLLHLLGYTHETSEIEEKEMFELQEKLLTKVIDLNICK